MLALDTSKTYGHIGMLAIFDPLGTDGASYAVTRQTVAERLHAMPPLRTRLQPVPLELDRPYWVDDEHFDLDYHIRHHAVPPPGTPEQLAEVVSRIVARTLDRTRPLWELYVIEGVNGGRHIAHLTKIHHAYLDGVAGAVMLGALLDTDPDTRPTGEVPSWTPRPTPSGMDLLGRAVWTMAANPQRLVRAVGRLGKELTDSSTRFVVANRYVQYVPGGVGDRLRRKLRSDTARPSALPTTVAPRVHWNGSVSAHRHLAFFTVSLERARAIRRATQTTFNDVVMALCGGVLRRYLLLHDDLPEAPLLAGMAISLRTGNEEEFYTNRVLTAVAELATDEPDPVARLMRIRASDTAAKDDFAHLPTGTLQELTALRPHTFVNLAMRALVDFRLGQVINPPFNVLISNVPGPAFPLYMAGAQLVHSYPVSIVAEGTGLNITVQSYCDNLEFGFIVDRELIPDPWVFRELMEEAMVELEEALGLVAAPPPKKRAPRKRAAPPR